MSITRNALRLGLASVSTLAVSLGATAVAQAKPQHCQPAGAHTLVANNYARVYGKNGKAYACVRSSGKTLQLAGADPSSDQFAIGGRFVGWSSSSDPNADPGTQLLPHSVITVMHLPDGHVDDYRYPFETNETVDKIVVASDGAAAWAITPPANSDSAFTIVQGTDRQSHPEDQFSDDHADLIGASLSIHGKTVTWRYVDGTTGSQKLY
jgi:hypothetical protein